MSDPGPPIGVLVVDDEWFWADAVVHQVEAMTEARSVGIAASSQEALAICARARPRVALVDLMLGDEDSGIRVAQTLAARFPDLRVVMVSVEPTGLAIAEARRAGLAGFVAKDDLLTRERVRELVLDVALGGTAYSPRVLELEAADIGDERYGLTGQEMEIIRCFSRGLGTPEIARLVCLAHQTVRNKTDRIGKKMGVKGRLEIVAKALQEGLILPPSGRR